MKKHAASLLDALAAVSITGVGFAIGGPIGSTVVAGIGVGFSTELVGKVIEKLRTRVLSSDNGLLNHDIQKVLARAFMRALSRLEDEYFRTARLPRSKQALIRALFKELKRDTQSTFVGALKDADLEEIRSYLYGDRVTTEQRFWERINLSLSTYPVSLQAFMRARLLDEVVFLFGEELKADNEQSNRAWRVFQRLLLEGMRAGIASIQAGQEDLRKDLGKLDEIAAQLDRLQDAVDRRLPDDQEPFQGGFNRAVEALGERLEQIHALTQEIYEATKETGEKLDLVLHHLDVEKRKTCFVTGPRDRREKLMVEVIEPVLSASDVTYEIAFSEASVQAIDLKHLEEADLVIADLTESDFGVIYELTCAHCLGRPDIAFIDESMGFAQSELPFDIQVIDLNDIGRTRAVLQQALSRIERAYVGANPITSFFKAPLTEMSPAFGLALGYGKNFVMRAARIIREIRLGRRGYVEVMIQQDDAVQNVRIEDPNRLARATLRILIPPRLNQAQGAKVQQFFNDRGLPEVTIGDADAKLSFSRLRLLPGPETELVIADIPTTMNVMTEAIEDRLGKETRTDSDAWRAYEQREITHFVNSLWRVLSEFDEEIDYLSEGLVEIVALNKQFNLE